MDVPQYLDAGVAADESRSKTVGTVFRGNAAKLCAIRFFFWMHFMASVLVPFMRDWAGLSFTALMLLNAWFMLCNFLLEIPTGTVADVWGRRTSLLLGCVIAAVASLVYASTPHYAVFLLGELLFACALTLLSGADEALLYDSLLAAGESDRSKTALARLESFKLAGIVVGALLGSIIAGAWGVRAPMLLQSAPMLVAALIALTLREPRRQTAETHGRAYVNLLTDGVRYFLRHRILRILALDLILNGTFTWLIIWLYQPLLEAAGIGLGYFGIVHALMCIGQITLLSNVTRVEGWLGSKRRVLFVSAIVPGLAFLALSIAARPPLVVAGVLAAASFGLSRGPLFSNYMNKYIPSHNRATVLSTVSMLRTLAIALTNPIAGLLADWSIHGTMAVFGGMLVVVSLLSRVEEGHLFE